MLRIFILFFCVILFSSCGKNKFTSEPQIEFESITPNTYKPTSILNPGPILTFRLRDSEGDFGFSTGKDTSYVYVKNITVPPFILDSIPFPTSTNIKRNNLNAEVGVDLKLGSGLLQGTGMRGSGKIDTLYFEVYVRDFANHKSNIIKTPKPVYFQN